MPAASTRVVTNDKPYGEWDFPLPVGMDYSFSLSWQDDDNVKADLDGYYAELELRFNGQPVLKLTTDDHITITTEDGASDIFVLFPASATKTLVLAPHQYFFRLVAPGGQKLTLFAGNANLIPS
jgi:hypothetical protein